MPRETKEAKADRLLTTGRIWVTDVRPSAVVARVRGTGALHTVEWKAGAWSCTCPNPARYADCSHLLGVKKVTAVDIEESHR